MYASLSEVTIPQLWASFMPYHRLITNAVSNDFFAIQQYDSPTAFHNFTPQTKYTHWAAKEVCTVEEIPSGMEELEILGGTYAVFLHKGTPSEISNTMFYIFTKWLPASAYVLDGTREHFQVMGEKYKNNHPDSEEEVWIPIIKK